MGHWHFLSLNFLITRLYKRNKLMKGHGAHRVYLGKYPTIGPDGNAYVFLTVVSRYCHVLYECFPLKRTLRALPIQSASWMPGVGKVCLDIWTRIVFPFDPLHDPFSMKVCRISDSALCVTYFLFLVDVCVVFIKSISVICFYQLH